MELIIIWLITIIASFIMEISQEMRIFKDVADAGYKMDIKRLSELSSQLNPNIKKANLISFLIPFYNILTVMKNTIVYNNYRNIILDQLSVIDALEEMSEQELLEYSKKRTGFNAIKVALNTEIRLSRAKMISIKDSKIYFETGDNGIEILKVEGRASKLTLEEQIQLVKSVMYELIKDDLSNYDESVAQELRNEYGDMDILGKLYDFESSGEETVTSSTSDKIQELKKLREETTGSSDEKDVTVNKEEPKQKKYK